MSKANAENLLQRKCVHIATLIKTTPPLNSVDLISMHNKGKIKMSDNYMVGYLQIIVDDSEALRSVNICNAIALMLVKEGNSLYDKERLIREQEISSFEEQGRFLVQQLKLLKESLAKREIDSYIQLLKDTRDFYEKKYVPLMEKTLILKRQLEYSNNFMIISPAIAAKGTSSEVNWNKLGLILFLGVLAGIIKIFLKN